MIGEKKSKKEKGKEYFICFSVSTSPKWMRVVSKDSPQLSLQGAITTWSNREGEKSRKKRETKRVKLGKTAI
jgi:hypothetical protein